MARFTRGATAMALLTGSGVFGLGCDSRGRASVTEDLAPAYPTRAKTSGSDEVSGPNENGSAASGTALTTLPTSPPPPPECVGLNLVTLLDETFVGEAGSASRTVSFAAPSDEGRYFVSIARAEASDKGVVRVNGQTVAMPSDFKRDLLRFEVDLGTSNELEVEVKGRGSLGVMVEGLVDDHAVAEGSRNHVFETTLHESAFTRGDRTETISAPETRGLFWLGVQSGLGRERATASTLTWNGADVFDPRDLAPRAERDAVPILLQPSNELAVSIRGGANAFLRASVSGFMVDNDPPTVAISRPLEGACVGLDEPVSATISDTLSGVRTDTIQVIFGNVDVTSACRVSGGTVTAVLRDFPALTLASGERTLIVRACDVAANHAEAQVTVHLDVDPPQVTLTPAAGSRVFTSSVALIASYVDADCGVDLPTFHATLAGPDGAVDVTHLFTVGLEAAHAQVDLEDGTYTLAVTLSDVVHNTAIVSATFEVLTTGDVTGTVVDANGLPLAGATVSADTARGRIEAQSDAAGRFTLPLVPQGDQPVVADGYALGRSRTTRVAHVVAGQTIDAGPWVLTSLPTGTALSLDAQGRTTSTLIVSNPAVAGATVMIPAGTLVELPAGFDFPAGTTPTLALHELPLVDLPTGLPEGVMPDGPIVSLQVEGIELDGLQLTLPAGPSHAPGEVVPIYQFDPNVDEFVVVAQGTVSTDGQTILATLQSHFYPVFAGPGQGAGEVVRVFLSGQVRDGIVGGGINGLTVTALGKSAVTSTVGVQQGFFGLYVLGRIGQEVDIRVTGTFSQGTISATVRTPIQRSQTDPQLGLATPHPLQITILEPVTVHGKVVVGTTPAAGVLVELVSGGSLVLAQPIYTDAQGEFTLTNVRLIRAGQVASTGQVGTVPQDLVVRAERAFGTTQQPEVYVFAGTLTITSPQPGTVIDRRHQPIALVGPGPSAGQPGQPGTGGVPNDPIANGQIVVSSRATINGNNNPLSGLHFHGLEYSDTSHHLFTVNISNTDAVWIIDPANPGAGFGLWNLLGFPFGSGGGGAQRDPITLTLQPGENVNGIDVPRGFVVDGANGNVYVFGTTIPFTGRPVVTLGPLGNAVCEADKFGGLYVADDGHTGATRWFYINEFRGQLDPAPIASTPRLNLDHLTREPDTERYFYAAPLGNGSAVTEEINPVNGQILGQPWPGDGSRLLWPAFDELEDPNGGGKNLYGVVDPVNVGFFGGPAGTRVVAKKRRSSPLLYAGEPHYAGLETTIYRAPTNYAIYGLAFGPSTADQRIFSLYALQSNIEIVGSGTAELVELRFDPRTVFVGGTFGTPGTPEQPAVLDSNNDGLIDNIEVLLYGHLLAPGEADADDLSVYQELIIYNTDPLDLDTDDDGYRDDAEVAGGSDPNDPTSTPAALVALLGGPLTVEPNGSSTFTLSITAGGKPHPFVSAVDLSINGNATFQGGATTLTGVPHGGSVQLEGGVQGFASITVAGGVSASLPVPVRSTRFIIEAQCPVRNAPCSHCGLADAQDGAFVNVSPTVAGFFWGCQVLPTVAGRNGLSFDWTLRTSSRAHSLGGWFGVSGATLACFERIRRGPSGSLVYQERAVRDHVFDRPAVGNGGATARGRYEVMRQSANEIVLRRPNGDVLRFFPLDASHTAGALRSVETPFGDRLTFIYDGLGQLISAQDVFGRTGWTFRYDSIGRLSAIEEDPSLLRGRRVDFSYDPQGRLTRIALPPVTITGGVGAIIGNPNANLFTDANGRRLAYVLTYQPFSGSLRADTNIRQVIAPNEVVSGTPTPRIINNYSADDRLASQTWGGPKAVTFRDGTTATIRAGGTITYGYGVNATTVTDRNGNVTIYTVDPTNGLATVIEERTNRQVRGAGNDPVAFFSRRTYNQDDEVTRLELPEGNVVDTAFDASNASRFAHGNLLTITRRPDAIRGGDGAGSIVAPLVQSFTYEPIFQGQRTSTSARGHHPVDNLVEVTPGVFMPSVPAWDPPVADAIAQPNVQSIDFDLNGIPNDEGPTAARNLRRRRYTSVTLYDYQEGSAGTIAFLSLQQWIPLSSTQAQALALSADLNQDGTTAQRVGRPIETRAPTVTLEDGSAQRITTNYRWNAFGLLKEEVDPEGYLTRYLYSPAIAPSAASGSPDGGGYIFERVADAGRAIRTPQLLSGVNDPAPVQAVTTTIRDAVGNVVEDVDPRGIRSTVELNELDLVVRTRTAVGVTSRYTEGLAFVALNYERRIEHDANGNTIRTLERNIVDQGGGDHSAQTNEWFEDTAVFDLLDRLSEEAHEVAQAGETRTIRGRAWPVTALDLVVSTRYRYDRNRNLVLELSPMAVKGAEPNNVRSWIVDERDLPWKATRGGLAAQWKDPTLGANADLLADFSGLKDDGNPANDTATMRTFVDSNGNAVLTLDAVDHGTAPQPLVLGLPGNPAVTTTDGDSNETLRDGFDRALTTFDAMGFESSGGCACGTGGRAALDPDGNVLGRTVIGPPGGNQRGRTAADRILGTSDQFHDEVSRAYRVDIHFFKTPQPLVSPNLGVEYTSRTTFDRCSRVVRSTRPLGNFVERAFDGLHREVLSRTNPLRGALGVDVVPTELRSRYDKAGNLVQTINIERSVDATRVETFYVDAFYDAVNRRTMSVSNNFANLSANATRREFDSRGRVVAALDANGSVQMALPLDRGGPVPVTINVTGNATITIHDALGREVAEHQELREDHDGSRPLLAAPHPQANLANDDGYISTGREWDANSRCVAETDDVDSRPGAPAPNPSRTTYVHDDLNRRVVHRNADGTFQTFTFDRDDLHVALQDENQTIFRRTFDDDHRLVSNEVLLIVDPIVQATTTLQTFERDGRSLLTRSVDRTAGVVNADTSCVYDSLSRRTEESSTISGVGPRRVGIEYDANSNEIQLTYPGDISGPGRRRVTYGFRDDLGRTLNRIHVIEDGSGAGTGDQIVPSGSNAALIARYSYIGMFRVASRMLGNGVPTGNGPSTVFGFDSLRRLTDVQHTTASGQTIAHFRSAFDRAHNRLSEAFLHEGRQDVYHYDSLGRMIVEGRGAPLGGVVNNQAGNPQFDGEQDRRSWQLDGADNWIRVVGQAVPSLVLTSNEVDQYTVVNGVPRAHDANGNVVDDGVLSYRFDAFNRLVRVIRNADGLDIALYTYDGRDRRVQRVVQNAGLLNETVKYYHVHDEVIEETDGAGMPRRQYVWGERLLEVRTGGLTFYCHENGYGSIARTTMRGGGTLDVRDFNAYGEVVQGGTPTGLPYGFHGWRLDPETGLYNFPGGVSFDPKLGRTLQRGGFDLSWYGLGSNNIIFANILPAQTAPVRPQPRPPIRRGPYRDPARRPRAPGRRGRPGEEEKKEDVRQLWELEVWELQERISDRERASDRKREIEDIEQGRLGPEETEMWLNLPTQIRPGDSFVSDDGCRVVPVAHWEEVAHAMGLPWVDPQERERAPAWMLYQHTVTGQTGSFLVYTRPPVIVASYDGIRISGNKIIVGIEAKARANYDRWSERGQRWEVQASGQVAVAQACGFRTAWVLGDQRAFNDWRGVLRGIGVDEVYHSPATEEGGGQRYEPLRLSALRSSTGPGMSSGE